MSKKDDKIKTIGELFLGNPHQYEHIRVDRSFYDTFKSRIIEHEKVRKEFEKRTGEKYFNTWKHLTGALAQEHSKRKLL